MGVTHGNRLHVRQTLNRSNWKSGCRLIPAPVEESHSAISSQSGNVITTGGQLDDVAQPRYRSHPVLPITEPGSTPRSDGAVVAQGDMLIIPSSHRHNINVRQVVRTPVGGTARVAVGPPPHDRRSRGGRTPCKNQKGCRQGEAPGGRPAGYRAPIH